MDCNVHEVPKVSERVQRGLFYQWLAIRQVASRTEVSISGGD
jgi:hypothetical protein